MKIYKRHLTTDYQDYPFLYAPKIHKINNPGRPINNSTGFITEKISTCIHEKAKTLTS